MRLAVISVLLSLPGAASAAETFQGKAFYFGDLHAHTGYSEDGAFGGTSDCVAGDCGLLDDFADTAIANGVDFVAVTDHINGNASGYPTEDTSAFADMRDRVAAWNDPDHGFVMLLGAEVFLSTSSTNYGHRSLIFFGDDADLADLTMPELWPSGTELYTTLTGCDQVGDWMDTLTADHGDALILPHHPLTYVPSGTNWSCHFPEYEPAVEVYSVQGNSLSSSSTSYDLPGGSRLNTAGAIHNALDPAGYAYRLGFFASTDRHDTRPGETCVGDNATGVAVRYAGGLAAVVLDEHQPFDRGAIHGALVARTTYATSGPMIPALVSFSARGVELGGMGEELLLPLGQDLDVTVSLPEADADVVLDVTLVAPGEATFATTDNGDGTFTTTIAHDTVPEWLYARVHIDGDAWWGAGNCADNGANADEYLWLSPAWFADGPGDFDADSFDTDTDCDDDRADVFPGAVEVYYDGVDQDCAGDSDFDADGDGFDAAAWGGTDCDDADAGRWPGAPDPAGDGLDSNCDGAAETVDGDGDGFGPDTDCDDGDPSVYPYAYDAPYDGIDADCAGDDDYDADGDGDPAEAWGGTDCDDTDAAVHPGATEIWYDDIDEDCDGGSDHDQDGDGYRTIAAGGSDCDDTNRAVRPSARERWYDGVDQNCDGRDDYDQDRDGAGASAYGGTDCNDTNAAIRPGASEIWYDGVDQNCDGRDDYDRDGDGWPRSTDCNDGAPRIYPGATGWNLDCTRAI